MLFSILIAHYNNFAFFRKCFDSLKNQTYQDFEIILIDDCSTDGSFEKILEFTKNYPKLKAYKNTENKGVGFTKKRCVDMASGEVCGFVDPDDALTPDALYLNSMAYRTKDTIAAYSQFYICDEKLNIQKTFPNTRKIKNRDPLFFNINFEASHFFTFKKEAYLKTEGINENYKVAEDMDFYLKLYETGNFKYIKKPLYLYRVHSSGLSHDQSKADLKNSTWHSVLFNTAKRRGLKRIYGQNINAIENLPEFLHKKQNTIYKKILKKISC